MNIILHSGTSLTDWAIRLWTGGPISHCEIEFSNGDRFAATPNGGCMFMPRLNLYDTENLNIRRIYLGSDIDDEAFIECFRLGGCKYDWKGIFLSEFIPLNRQNANKFWCSELVVTVLNRIEYFTKRRGFTKPPSSVVSPNRLPALFNTSWKDLA